MPPFDGIFPQITSAEIVTVASALSNGKMPGPDNIPNEVVKSVASVNSGRFLKLFQMYRRGLVPGRVKVSKCSPFAKTRTACGQFICLQSSVYAEFSRLAL